jgi:acyl-CoA thioesterase FadM
MSKLRSNKMHKSGDSRIGKRPVADLESLMMQQGDQFDATRCVSFSDTDASGRVHFTAILRYVEDAEHLFFASLGIAVIGGNHGWPRVHIDCDYRAPLTFGDEVQIRLVVQVVGKSSVKYTFAVKKFDQLCAEGSMVIVRVDG